MALLFNLAHVRRGFPPCEFFSTVGRIEVFLPTSNRLVLLHLLELRMLLWGALWPRFTELQRFNKSQRQQFRA